MSYRHPYGPPAEYLEEWWQRSRTPNERVRSWDIEGQQKKHRNKKN